MSKPILEDIDFYCTMLDNFGIKYIRRKATNKEKEKVFGLACTEVVITDMDVVFAFESGKYLDHGHYEPEIIGEY